MRYRLRTLMILTAVAPPLLAGAYWIGAWLASEPETYILMAICLYLGAYLAIWIVGPVAWYYELVNMVCGPNLFRPARRKARRVVRVRIERCGNGSST